MRSKLQSSILVLPTEVIEKVFILVDDSNDLRTLTNINRLFALIACHMYATQHGICVTNTFIKIQGSSFQALATWRCSRLFTTVREALFRQPRWLFLKCELQHEFSSISHKTWRKRITLECS
jgi:hypothetical protein